MNHPHSTKQRGFSSVIDRRPKPPPPKPKGLTADVAAWGIELLVLPRGDGVRLRLSLERYSHGPRLVATEWAKSAEGYWYPRRSRSLALALDEESAFDKAFSEARRRLSELPAEVQR